ncbi:MAG: arsenite methyltransferase [Anaerolineales bacterium]
MDDTSVGQEEIKETVRDYYAEAARRASQIEESCCAQSSCCDARENQLGYDLEELHELPQQAVESALGCGNPVALASLKPGEVVLDLGSGGGIDVLMAARRVGSGGYVYGLDMTDEMIELANRNAEKLDVSNAEFLKGEIEQIPLPDSCVDVIISNCVINLSPDKAAVLQEAGRVLRPGGRLAVSDIVIDGDLGGLPVSEGNIRASLSWSGCVAGALTMHQYRAYLEQAGFVDIQVEVKQRFSLDRDLPSRSGALAELEPEGLRELFSRFTSSYITARMPA